MIESARTRYTDNFYFHSGDLFIGRSIQLYGEYTQLELDIMSNFLNDRCIVYDVGGNIGYHATGFASMAKEVHVFEPNNKNFELLERNTKDLDNVYLYNCAVSDEDGVAFISDYDTETPGNYGVCEMSNSGQMCKTVRLDSLDIDGPDLIKIDAEGHELAVIKGAANTIVKNRPMIFYECLHGSGFDEIYDFLTGLGYAIYWIPVTNFNPNNFYKNPENVFGSGGVVNCLAAPPQIPELRLHRMISRDDTYAKLLERLTSQAK